MLALPRGGVPVGYEVARALAAPLDVLVVRKLGVPGQQELAFGALASGGWRVVNETVVAERRLDESAVAAVVADEKDELERRERRYRAGRPVPVLAGREVVVVDDGLATGATAAVAVEAVRAQHPARLVVASPVASPQAVARLEPVVDAVVCVTVARRMRAVGDSYDDFSPVDDAEVGRLLAP